MKLSKKRIAFFSLAHLAVLIVFFTISYSAGMDAFDGTGELTAWGRLSGTITEVLMSPLYLLWNEWASRNVPDAVEMILFLMNSVLWGTGIETLYGQYRRRYARALR